jgi:hypothetical protein
MHAAEAFFAVLFVLAVTGILAVIAFDEIDYRKRERRRSARKGL